MFSVEKHGKERLKKSVFGYFFQREDVCCAYNALKIITIYFDAVLSSYILKTTEIPIVEVLRGVPEVLREQFISVLTAICNAHILVPINYNELTYLEKVKKIAFNGPKIRVLVLHLTDYCNLRCRYCFIEGNIPKGYKRQNMTEEIVEKAIDKFGQVIVGRTFPKPPSIVLYGGEPLVNWKVVKHGLEYLMRCQKEKRLPSKVDKILITNGTLITSEIAADCTGCGEQMSVSPDGQIGICQGYMGSRKTFSSSVFDTKYDPSEDPVFIEWSQRSPLNMPQCYQCLALATCGGGCPRNADYINGSIWEVDSAFCHFAKKAQKWMIWKKYEAEQKT